MTKIIFMGTPDFAVPTLKSLLHNPEFDITSVVTQPPRPQGRGHKIIKSAIHQCAETHGIRVLTPQTLKTVVDNLQAQQPDFIVVVAYGHILSQNVLDIPKYGCINVHGSLLPRWRGAAPIHRAVLAGDRETGITTMLMDKGLDTGGMFLQEKIMILPQDTTATLHDRLAYLGANLLVKTLENIRDKGTKPIPQPEEGVTYAEKLEKQESLVDWRESGKNLARKIRAFKPWPGTYFYYADKKIKILNASFEPLEAGRPGDVLRKVPLTVSCGLGALELKELQVQGKSPITGYDFVNGFHIEEGVRLCPDIR